MAYAASSATNANPPTAVAQVIGSTGGVGPKLWLYKSTHVQAEVSSTGFFTDGQKLGMSLSDVVLVIGSTTYIFSAHAVNVVTSTGVGLTTGLIVSSAS